MNLSDPHILNQIKFIGYPAMLLLMTVEGPMATILAAFAASLGFFNVYLVFLLSMLGDILGDVILYSIGYAGGAKTLEKAKSFLRIKSEIVQKIEKLFAKHGRKTIFAVKSTTGLCWITFIAAGAVRMKFKDFFFGSFWGGIVWSGFLVIMGYFFGYAFEKINDYLRYAGIAIASAVIGSYLLITFYKKYKSKKILANNNSAR